jgi:hypothetical protein
MASIANERGACVNDDTLKAGLLMESVQAQQRGLDESLQTLHAHTRGLDAVVRDEIRRTLVEEFHMLGAETRRVASVLQAAGRAAGWRAVRVGLVLALSASLAPATVIWWIVPSRTEIAALRAERDALAANMHQLGQQGGRIQWRRCGEAQRLCVRVERAAPAFGESADFLIVKGY